MGYPSDCGKSQHSDGHDGGFAAAPSRRGSQENENQISPPSEKGDRDIRLADPGGLMLDEGPGAGGDYRESHQNEANAHGLRDQVIESAERGQAVIEFAGLLSL